MFTISQLQQYSGIKAHTIRIWEKRYQALNPSRTDGNTRLYDNSQLKRLLNIVSLMSRDHKVSELCSMSDHQLNGLINSKASHVHTMDETSEYFVSQLISSSLVYEEQYFDKMFANAILRFGLKDTYLKVIYPMLVRVGLMWNTDSITPPQEHFASNLIRQKLYTAIDSLPYPESSKDSWLLFLPENEFHEIGLLFSNYLIRLAGKKVTYLGCNVPIETLAAAIEQVNPKHLLFFLVHHNLPEIAQRQMNSLVKDFGKSRIHVAGNETLIGQLKLTKNIQWIQSIEDLESEIYKNKHVYI